MGVGSMDLVEWVGRVVGMVGIGGMRCRMVVDRG